jgi:hypothetical protein
MRCRNYQPSGDEIRGLGREGIGPRLGLQFEGVEEERKEE